MTKNKTAHYKAWMHLANTWGELITPPAKPCSKQLKIWSNVLKRIFQKSRLPRALIFGATPELRNLALRAGFRVTICDINPLMVRAMNQYVPAGLRKREKVVIGDWLTINLPEKYFDLVMGDCILNQMSGLKNFQRLIRRIHNFLKPGGVFLFREVVRLNKKLVIKNDQDWLKFFQDKKIEYTDLYMLFKYQSNANFCRKSPFLCYSPSVFNKIAYFYRRGQCPEKFWQWLNLALGKHSKPVLIFVKKDLDRLLKKHFKLVNIPQCHDYRHCRYMPLYLARLK